MENEYLSDGLTEEIISRLAAVPALRVVARTSAFQFKGRSADVRTIGRELGAAKILEGGVRREGRRIRVTAQLINGADGLHLWSRIYDREAASVLDVEQEITRAVVDTLRIRLRHSQPDTNNSQAHEAYLKGLYFYNKMTPEDVKKSIDSLEHAIALDPNYAAAHGALADVYGFWANLELEPPGTSVAKAEREAQRALELDPDSAEGHFVKAAIQSSLQWDWKGGETKFRRALELKPSLTQARMTFAVLCLSPQRRYSEAVEQFRRALETDPLSVSLRTLLVCWFSVNWSAGALR